MCESFAKRLKSFKLSLFPNKYPHPLSGKLVIMMSVADYEDCKSTDFRQMLPCDFSSKLMFLFDPSSQSTETSRVSLVRHTTDKTRGIAQIKLKRAPSTRYKQQTLTRADSHQRKG